MRKLPWFKFHHADWITDANLRRCTHAARGVWIDVLCLMYGCEDRGVLQTAGRAWSDDEIAQAVGGLPDVTASCIAELVAKGVAHRTASGALYSKRMVRDNTKSAKASASGRKGGRPPDQESEIKATNGEIAFLPLTSDSLFWSVVPDVLKTEEFKAVWKQWLEYRASKKKAVSDLAAKQQLVYLSSLGDKRAIESIRQSIRNDWTGLFDPKDQSPRAPSNAPKPQAKTAADFLSIVQSASQTDPRRLPKC